MTFQNGLINLACFIAQVDWVLVGLSFIDVLILTIWAIIDPQMRTLEYFQLENPLDTEKDIKIRPSMEHCESKHQNIWLGIIWFEITISD